LILGSSSVLLGFSWIAFKSGWCAASAASRPAQRRRARAAGPVASNVGAAGVGAGAGFIGLVFVLTSIHHWFVNPDRNVSLVLIPIGLVTITIGIALLV